MTFVAEEEAIIGAEVGREMVRLPVAESADPSARRVTP
jgi:hypothetical protein